jgi:hypothetical protein
METQKPLDQTPLAGRQGIVSLVLAVPGLTLVGLAGINAFILHNRLLERWLSHLGFEDWLMALLWAPIVGMVVGLCGRGSRWGRWGIVSTGLLLVCDLVYLFFLANADI